MPEWVIQLVTIAAFVGGAIYVVARVETLTNILRDRVEKMHDTQVQHGNRLSVLETIITAVVPDHLRSSRKP